VSSVSLTVTDFLLLQERPIDVVADGFIHLQQFHMREVVRGLAGCGSYRLRPEFPRCDSVPPLPAFPLPPENIVAVLHRPTDEVQARN